MYETISMKPVPDGVPSRTLSCSEIKTDVPDIDDDIELAFPLVEDTELPRPNIIVFAAVDSTDLRICGYKLGEWRVIYDTDTERKTEERDRTVSAASINLAVQRWLDKEQPNTSIHPVEYPVDIAERMKDSLDGVVDGKLLTSLNELWGKLCFSSVVELPGGKVAGIKITERIDSHNANQFLLVYNPEEEEWCEFDRGSTVGGYSNSLVDVRGAREFYRKHL